MIENPVVYECLVRHYLSLPHCQALGLMLCDISTYRPLISLNNTPKAAHEATCSAVAGGAVAALVDVVSAAAVAARLAEFEVLATLDMRLDYLRDIHLKAPLLARAECYTLSGQVAHVRAHCFFADEGEENPVALGVATFIRSPLSDGEKTILKQVLVAQKE